MNKFSYVAVEVQQRPNAPPFYLIQALATEILASVGKQPTHTTWWPYEGVDRASLFSIVPEER
jgi:hypothetical protein